MYSTRDIAVDIITDVMQNDAYSHIALKRELNKYNHLKKEDRAFITEISNGTLRNIVYIDYIISQFSKAELNKIKPTILNILRITVYQLKFMDRVPAFAACDEAVKIAKKRGYIRLSAFVNGITRNISRNIHNINLPSETKQPLKYLSTVYSYNQWILEKLLQEYEYPFVKQMCIANNTPVDVTICVNTLKTDTLTLKRELLKSDIEVKDGLYSNQALHLSKTSSISQLTYYRDGLFHIQDESSILAVNVLDPHPNEFIIDMCAAPGGKSLLCAEKMNNRGIIKSRDIYDYKLKMIADSVKRMGIDIIEIQNMDATVLDSKSIDKADRVIVDAPCSGLGIIRKKADIKLKKKKEDIAILKDLQKKILTVAAEYVKLDGILVYSTCTVISDENIANIKWFIENFPFELENIDPFLPNNIDELSAQKGYIQLYPNVHFTDGFFIARMRRKR